MTKFEKSVMERTMNKDKGGVASLAQPNTACLSTCLLTFRIVVSIVCTVFKSVQEFWSWACSSVAEHMRLWGSNPGSDLKAAKSGVIPCPDLDLFFSLYKYLKTELRFLACLDPGSNS